MLDNGRKRHNKCTSLAGRNIDWESVAWELLDELEMYVPLHLPSGLIFDAAIKKYSGPLRRVVAKERRKQENEI